MGIRPRPTRARADVRRRLRIRAARKLETTMRRISRASAILAVILAGGAGAGAIAGVTAHAQSPLVPAPPPETAPPLPYPSSDASGAYVGDVLYVHAGERPASRTASTGRAALYAHSPQDASWTTVWTGSPVRGAVLVSDGEDLYRVGGAEVHGARRARRDLQRWDRTDGGWVDLTPMPSGRTDHAAVIDGRRLWVVGGWAPSALAEGRGARLRPPGVPAEDWRDDVLVADLDADPVTWTVVETPSLRLHSLAAAVHGDAIWVAGDMTPRGPELEVHRLDLRTRTLAPGMPGRHSPTTSSRNARTTRWSADRECCTSWGEPRTAGFTRTSTGSRRPRSGRATSSRRRVGRRARQATDLRWPAPGAGPDFGDRRSVTARPAICRWPGRTRKTSRGGTRSGATASRAPWSGTASWSSPPSTARGARRRSSRPIELARNSLTVSERVYGVAAVDGALLVRTGRELIRIGRGGGTGR